MLGSCCDCCHARSGPCSWGSAACWTDLAPSPFFRRPGPLLSDTDVRLFVYHAGNACERQWCSSIHCAGCGPPDSDGQVWKRWKHHPHCATAPMGDRRDGRQVRWATVPTGEMGNRQRARWARWATGETDLGDRRDGQWARQARRATGKVGDRQGGQRASR